MVARVIEIDDAFDDPHAIRKLIERHGPYPSIASYLPPAATRGSPDDAERGGTLPWFRGNWAVNGSPKVAGAEAILGNARFIEAAARVFDTPEVRPTTVVVNINAPMPTGAVHVDIPSFRGATRDTYSLRLLQAMGTSGLFEPWRVVEVGVVAWFYGGAGGAYDYWPEGLEGPMRSARPPFGNTALAADNDRMFHRIGWIGTPDPAVPQLSADAEIRHVEGGWTITDDREPRARYDDDDIRLSVLWKASVLDDRSDDPGDALNPGRVADIINDDLRARGIATTAPASPTDEAWVDLVHATYYPPVVVGT